MNGPSGNRDLGNIFPAVDNDDGSAYYWVAENVVAYGGFKNFLGNDKVWMSNLILYPEGRTGNSGNGPCVMAWGGANEVYQNNTCVTRGVSGPGVSPYPATECSYSNKTAKTILLHLKENTYLNPAANYSLDCGGGHSLEKLHTLGEELGSHVGLLPPTESLLSHAAALLGMPSRGFFPISGSSRVQTNNRGLLCVKML